MATKAAACRVNGIDVNAMKETVNSIQNEPGLGKCRFQASNRWIGATHNCSTVRAFRAGQQEIAHERPFELHADEPTLLAGTDQGANPVEYLLHALAGCVTTTIVAHAAVRGIAIEEVESEVTGDIDLRGFLGMDPSVSKGYTNVEMRVKVKADVEDMDQLRELVALSPVFSTLLDGTNVAIQIQRK